MNSEDDLKRFVAKCPHCKNEVEMRLSVRLVGGMEAGRVNEPLSETPDRLTPGQRQFIDLAAKNGMLDAFKTAVQHGPMAEHPPKHMEVFFITVLRVSKPCIIPKVTLDVLRESFGPVGYLEFFSGNGVGIITVDKRIRAFMPVQLALGESVGNNNRSGPRYRMDADERALTHWIKTRMGYVPAGCEMFLEALRRKTIGDFANPLL